jgi:indole-3-glycerol phosphate synthase
MRRGRTDTEAQYTRSNAEGQAIRYVMITSSGPTVLDRILDTKRGELEELRPRGAEVRARAADMPPARDFAGALRADGEVRVLAEIKRRSPSAGPIRPGADPVEVALGYAAGGAAALSVLTDRQYFDGSLEVLESVRGAVDLPLLRKDFILDELQLLEARAAGADAVLLIVRALEPETLKHLVEAADATGLQTLVEVHNGDELRVALDAGARVVGVNNRDLATFVTDLDLSFRLAPEVPDAVTLVAESGIRTAADVRRLGQAGVDAVLVGESLMRQPDLEVAVSALTGQPKMPRRSSE